MKYVWLIPFVVSKTEDMTSKRAGDVQRNAAVDRRPTTARDWTDHEHVAQSITSEAQKLVKMVGSAGLAKQAIDANVEPISHDRLEKLAHELGYASVEEMLEVSTIVERKDGDSWWMTTDADGACVAWIEYVSELPQRFKTRELALERIYAGLV